MKARLFFIYCVVTMIFAAFIGIQPLQGAVAISTEDLARASDVVLRGVVEQTKSMWDAKAGTVITRANLKVTQVIRGSTNAKNVSFEFEGGTVGDLTLQLRDIASVAKGEDVIVFLKTKKDKSTEKIFLIQGDKQGKYTVKNGVVSKETDSVEGNLAVIDNNLPLSTFIKKIRGVL
ncbi:MAG: hypothetical protein HQL06_12875 [Nitrospirae bacterium]|nr:hypothetical protein [Nitrospirota bacterium]